MNILSLQRNRICTNAHMRPGVVGGIGMMRCTHTNEQICQEG